MPRTFCFLDLDHTLLNTDRFFWAEFTSAILSLGVPASLWKETYWTVWKYGYTPAKHYRYILKEKKSDIRMPGYAAFRKILHSFARRLPEFLYPDVLPFLVQARESGVFLSLLTFGAPSYQIWKVKNLHIEQFFDKVVYMGKKKEKGAWIAKFLPKGTIIVVDNNPQELDGVKRYLPGAETYWMIRPRDSEPYYEEANYYAEMTPEYSHLRIESLASISLA